MAHSDILLFSSRPSGSLRHASDDFDDEHDAQLRNTFAMMTLDIASRMHLYRICDPLITQWLPHGCGRRRIGRIPRPEGGIWRQMEDVWPNLPGTMEAEKYYEYFRMNRSGFDHVFQRVREAIETSNSGSDPRGRKAIPARQAFAAVTRWFAVGGSFRSVCDDFRIARSTLQKYAHIVAKAIVTDFAPDVIKWPAGQELINVMDDFKQLCGLPCVAGAIDGCFLEIKRPTGEFGDRYWCYKNKIAILLLAVTDCVGKFTFIDVGRPSSVGDAGAFRACELSDLLEAGVALPAQHGMQLPCGTTIGPYLLGDEAFPLLRYLQRCYEGHINERSIQGSFNRAVINGRRVVEQAFGRLKNRWRILLKSTEINDPVFFAEVATACCALHNYCEDLRLERIFPHIPDAAAGEDLNATAPTLGDGNNTVVGPAGATVRTALTHYLADN